MSEATPAILSLPCLTLVFAAIARADLSLMPLPSPLPAAFRAPFIETYSGAPFPTPTSSGEWFYNWPTRQWRVDHDEPQSNNFCACGVNTTTASCTLLFAPEGDAYVDFPGAPDSCCRFCDIGSGCSAIKPNWLSNATYGFFGVVSINGRSCYKYCVAGDEAQDDCMAADAEGLPCQYSEWFNFGTTTIVHNLTFSSVEVGPQDPHIFDIATRCRKECPRIFPTTCG